MTSSSQQKIIEKERVHSITFSGKLFILFITFLVKLNILIAQDTILHATPIFSTELDTATFYDRLEKVLYNGKITRVNIDSSFNWLVGSWAIEAKGFAKTGFQGKKEFTWQEPSEEFLMDQNHSLFVVFKDSTTITTKAGKQKALIPPQVILQYDNYSRVWVLQAGYYDRYDWGTLIATGWEGNKILFRGTISLAGLKVNQQETWTKITSNKFHILYEEQLQDHSWFKIEENIYTRAK
jgi:hypothetical protein